MDSRAKTQCLHPVHSLPAPCSSCKPECERLARNESQPARSKPARHFSRMPMNKRHKRRLCRRSARLLIAFADRVFWLRFPGHGQAPDCAVFHGIGQQARRFPTQRPLFEASCKYAFSWFEFRARAKPPSLFPAWPQETKKRTAMKWHAQAQNKPAFVLFRLAEMGLAP